jgi:predicted O-linked N-acetylglucosamine transferase (SPINDLY family)
LSDALASYERAVALTPDDAGSLSGALSVSVRTCNWQLAGRSLQQLRELPDGLKSIHPFLALSVIEDPAELASIAAGRAMQSMVAAGVGPSTSFPEPERREGRIRIAYVSSDLRDHPVAHLIVGLFEHHDRERFEVHAIALNPGADERLRLSVEHWHDVAKLSDLEIAQRMRTLQIDIAVDLNGHTIGARPGIFAHRAALIQVSYLGYAGTSGAPYMDYLVADDVVIPHADERWYTEHVIRLPGCFMPNDSQRAIGAAPTREQAGLPADGLVFCAFTNAYKINPPLFDIWMRLLREIPGSVLWLRSMGPEPKDNLLREAAARGVDAQRLVFAPHVASIAEHLGRHQLADLFLDTLPYNAHSTACDALWVGVPVLTCVGRTFAARVAASVLTTAGLPELITKDLPEYASLALQLARDPAQLRVFRQRLTQRSALFDTRAYCERLESAYSNLLISNPARA